jgi:hypothetical protein
MAVERPDRDALGPRDAIEDARDRKATFLGLRFAAALDDFGVHEGL